MSEKNMHQQLHSVATSGMSVAAAPPAAVTEKNLREISDRPGSALAASTLQLANLLQSTLDIEQLLELFTEETARTVPHVGLEYRNLEDKLLIAHGRDGKYSSNYDLVVLDKSLGEISFRSDEPLENHESERLEALICALVYPLRNALMYHRALETALRDPVTGISNRASLNSTIDREVNLSNRHSYALSVVMLDIDHFKRVNDTYGHIAGDAVLRILADRVTECARGSDMVFRYGGEEFTVLLSNTDINGAALFAERVRRKVEESPAVVDAIEIPITVSLGVAALEKGESASSLLGRADAALYDAKTAGRNRVMIQTSATN